MFSFLYAAASLLFLKFTETSGRLLQQQNSQRRLGVCRSLHRREKRTERAEGLDSPEPESRTMQEEDDRCLLALVPTHPLCFKP